MWRPSTWPGILKVFDFSAREADLVVKPVAEYRTAGGKQLRYLVFQGTQLWIAGNQLERLELQTTLGKLSQVRAYVPAQPCTAVAARDDGSRDLRLSRR